MPTADELKDTGLVPEDYARTEPVEVWPDCWEAFELLTVVRTQWRTSMGGPSGLDYGPLFALMDRRGLSPAEQLALFDDIQVMEQAALDEMHKKF